MSLHLVAPAPPRLYEIVSFECDEQSHTYKVNGEQWPSVTQILAKVGISDYNGMPERDHKYYLARGSAVHLALKMWCCGRRKEVEAYMHQVPEWSGYIRAGIAFLEQSGFKPLLVEQMLLNPIQRYTGKPDLIGTMGNRFALPDWKLTKARPATAIQTAAYAKAVRYLGCLPPVGVGYVHADEEHDRFGVPLHKDGRFGRIEWYDNVEDEGIWDAAVACFYWNREKYAA